MKAGVDVKSRKAGGAMPIVAGVLALLALWFAWSGWQVWSANGLLKSRRNG